MRRWLILSALVAAGGLASAGRAAAFGLCPNIPHTTSALYPCANPQGWYTDRYWFAWYYPWYAYYNYSHGPYANWAAGGGFATYANCGPGGCGVSALPGQVATYYGYRGYGGPTFGVPSFGYPWDYPGPLVAPGTLSINLPADAKLLFNGKEATGTGGTRTFRTTPLQPGQEYAYDLTAEVVRNGKVQTATERVVVRAGAETKVTLNVDAVRTAGK